MKASKWIVFATGLGVVGSAFAQSSVTLYGLLDVGLNHQSNADGKHLYNMTGMLKGDRWGLLVRRDSGGGLAGGISAGKWLRYHEPKAWTGSTRIRAAGVRRAAQPVVWHGDV